MHMLPSALSGPDGRMFVQQVEEYLSPGYLEPVDDSHMPGHTWFLPHHLVFNAH